MLKKALNSTLVAAAICAISVPAYSAQVAENLNIEGWVLMETWNDTHSFRDGQSGENQEPTVFTLHMVNFSGGGELDGDLGWSWKLGHRNRNGDFGGTGSTGARDAWLGVDGDFGEVKFGRILTRSFQELDWPYGSEAWLAEATSETGANIAIFSRAIRYTAPELAPGLTLEATYDFGQSFVDDADARALELFARWNVGKVRFDLVHQQHTDSPTTKANGADGVFGSDGNPVPVKGNEQNMTFLGMRVPMGAFEAVLGYKTNEWESDTAGFFNGFNWNPGKADTPGTKVENSRIHLGLNYRVNKWTYSGAIQKVNEGEDNAGGKLDDGATIIGLRAVRSIGKAASMYFGLRHTKFDGDFIPVDSYTWQVQNPWADATDSNTRIGFGLQMFY